MKTLSLSIAVAEASGKCSLLTLLNRKNKMMNRSILIALATLTLVSTSALAQTGTPAKGKPAPAKTQKKVQKFTVKVDGAYAPSVVTVKAGQPVEITFVKGKNVGCGNTVVFNALGITKELKGEKTIVAFTPKKAGTIAFACPMGMYKGSVGAK